MTLEKGKFSYKLNKHIDRLLGVSVLVNNMIYIQLVVIDPNELPPGIEPGRPNRVCFIKDELYIYPRPDRDYECKVLGVLIIEQ